MDGTREKILASIAAVETPTLWDAFTELSKRYKEWTIKFIKLPLPALSLVL